MHNEYPKESAGSVALHVWLPLILSFSAAVSSLVLDLRSNDTNWLQRSGVFLIVAGAYVGFHETKQGLQFRDGDLFLNPEIPYKLPALLWVLIGTVITGYADLWVS